MRYSYKGREIDNTKKAEVYFNLHNYLFSVWQKVVRCHADVVIVEDVTFRVRESGRQQVIESGTKNVHARVYGTIASTNREDVPDLTGYRRAHYKPEDTETFVDRETWEPIGHCERMVLIDKRMFYKK